MPLKKLSSEVRAGKIAPYYYLFGDERYLITKAVSILTKKLMQSGMGDFNLDKLSMTENSMENVLSSAYMLPMMADKRLIIVRDAEKIKEKDSALFLNFMENPVETSCIVFISNKDKVDQRLKFFSRFKKKGQVLEFKPLYESKLPYFINEEVKSLNKIIAGDAVSLLIRNVGNNLFELEAELKKIALGIGEKKLIEVKDVKEYSSDVRRNTVFEFADSIGNKNLKESLRILKKMLEQGEYVGNVLGAVIRHYNNLFEIRERLDKNEGRDSIAKATRIHPYFLKNYISQANKVSKKDLTKVFDNLLLTDIALKSRKLPNKIILEKLLFDLCI